MPEDTTYVDDYSADQSADTYGVNASGALDVLDRLSKIGLGVAGVLMPNQQKLNQEVERQRAQQAAQAKAANGGNKLLWIGLAVAGVLALILFLRR